MRTVVGQSFRQHNRFFVNLPASQNCLSQTNSTYLCSLGLLSFLKFWNNARQIPHIPATPVCLFSTPQMLSDKFPIPLLPRSALSYPLSFFCSDLFYTFFLIVPANSWVSLGIIVHFGQSFSQLKDKFLITTIWVAKPAEVFRGLARFWSGGTISAGTSPPEPWQ